MYWDPLDLTIVWILQHRKLRSQKRWGTEDKSYQIDNTLPGGYIIRPSVEVAVQQTPSPLTANGHVTPDTWF